VILAAGLTPAWQHLLLFRSLTPGAVNRAEQVHWCASGKALNVALALHHLGASCRALSPLGGPHGESIRREFADRGIPARWVPTAAPTRVCTTLIDTTGPTITELVENAPGLTAGELDAFRGAYAEEAASAAVVVLSGSLPAGTPADFYRELLARTPGRAVLDVRGPELLGALDRRPFLVKPNREELARTLGRGLHQDTDLFDAMAELNRRGAGWVVVTDGKRPAHARSAEGLYRLNPPPRPVVNPIGCGDCMAAGIAIALDQGLDPVEALRYGAAAAADNLSQLLPARLDPVRVKDLAAAIEVVRVRPRGGGS
jgi:1-phosphofructokinase family hexose kinase